MSVIPFDLPQLSFTPPQMNPGVPLTPAQQFLRKQPSRGTQLNSESAQGIKNERPNPLGLNLPSIVPDAANANQTSWWRRGYSVGTPTDANRGLGTYGITHDLGPSAVLPTTQPAVATPPVAPPAAAGIPDHTSIVPGSPALAALPPMQTKLAGGEASTYTPTTLAGALVEHNETKRQSTLQQQDNTNALAAYNAGTAATNAGTAATTASSESALRGLQGVDLQNKAEQDQRTADLQKELLDPKVTAARREQIMSAIHGYSPASFEGFPVHDPQSGLITGMKVLDKRTGALNDPDAKAVTTADAQAAVKAGASKVEVNKRLVAAGLPPL